MIGRIINILHDQKLGHALLVRWSGWESSNRGDWDDSAIPIPGRDASRYNIGDEIAVTVISLMEGGEI